MCCTFQYSSDPGRTVVCSFEIRGVVHATHYAKVTLAQQVVRPGEASVSAQIPCTVGRERARYQCQLLEPLTRCTWVLGERWIVPLRRMRGLYIKFSNRLKKSVGSATQHDPHISNVTARADAVSATRPAHSSASETWYDSADAVTRP